MERYTIAQRTQIVFLFIENHRSIINTQRAYRRFYGVRTASTGPTIRSLVDNFAEFGTVGDLRRMGRPRTGRSIEIGLIPQETLHKVMENAIKRADFCVRENGSHLTDIIFHT
jgi:hypothetical protein